MRCVRRVADGDHTRQRAAFRLPGHRPCSGRIWKHPHPPRVRSGGRRRPATRRWALEAYGEPQALGRLDRSPAPSPERPTRTQHAYMREEEPQDVGRAARCSRRRGHALARTCRAPGRGEGPEGVGRSGPWPRTWSASTRTGRCASPCPPVAPDRAGELHVTSLGRCRYYIAGGSRNTTATTTPGRGATHRNNGERHSTSHNEAHFSGLMTHRYELHSSLANRPYLGQYCSPHGAGIRHFHTMPPPEDPPVARRLDRPKARYTDGQ